MRNKYGNNSLFLLAVIKNCYEVYLLIYRSFRHVARHHDSMALIYQRNSTYLL